MRRLSTRGRGQEDPRSSKASSSGRSEVVPLPTQVAPVPTSFFHPAPQERKAAVSAQRSPSSPHPVPRSAPQHPHPRASAGPASGPGLGLLRARLAQCAPPRAGEAGGECLPCTVPGNSGAITGPRRLPGADCADSPHQGTRSRHCPGGGEKIAGNLLGNYLAQDLRGVCLPCGPTHEAGVGPVGPGALPPAPLQLTESCVSSAAPSQPGESLPRERPFPAAPGSSRGGPAWVVAVEALDGLWGPE